MLIEYACNILQSNIGALSGNLLATTGEKPGSSDFCCGLKREISAYKEGVNGVNRLATKGEKYY